MLRTLERTSLTFHGRTRARCPLAAIASRYVGVDMAKTLCSARPVQRVLRHSRPSGQFAVLPSWASTWQIAKGLDVRGAPNRRPSGDSECNGLIASTDIPRLIEGP